MDVKRRSLVFLCSVALLLASPAVRDSRGDEPERQAMACPKCGRTGGTKFCSEDGAPLVRSDLVVFHRVVSLLATGETRDPAFQNPFKGLLSKDGQIDLDGLSRLVSDYEEAAKRSPFSSYTGPMPLYPPLAESDAIAALQSIVVAERTFRKGRGAPAKGAFGTLAALGEAGLVDRSLASGRKGGWVFDARPSTADATALFYATAVPERPGKERRFLFVNQTGEVHASLEPFSVDSRSCAVPAGLSPLLRTLEPSPEPPVEDEPVPGLDELKVGQVFVIRSNNGVPITIQHSVLAKDDREVTLSVLVEAPNAEPRPDILRLPLRRAKGAAKPAFAVLDREKLAVSGIEFDCEIRESTASESGKKERVWFCERRYPNAIKRQDESGKTTWELIEVRGP